MQQQHIPVFGLVGGIGSGKSRIAQQLADEVSIKLIDGDKIGHQALKDPDVIGKLKIAFGESILTETGEVDRRKLAAIVFSVDATSADSLTKLEKIVHPYIEGTIAAEIRQNQKCDAIILDAAVLFEAGWDRFCDRVVYVDVPENIRFERIEATRDWSRSEWQSREARQISTEEKRNRADAVIDNSESVTQAVQQMKTCIEKFTKSKQ